MKTKDITRFVLVRISLYQVQSETVWALLVNDNSLLGVCRLRAQTTSSIAEVATEGATDLLGIEIPVDNLHPHFHSVDCQYARTHQLKMAQTRLV